jgi:hypothetical protein
MNSRQVSKIINDLKSFGEALLNKPLLRTLKVSSMFSKREESEKSMVVIYPGQIYFNYVKIYEH